MKKFINNHIIILLNMFLCLIFTVLHFLKDNHDSAWLNQLSCHFALFVWMTFALFLEYYLFKKTERVLDISYEKDSLVKDWYREMEKRVTAESNLAATNSQLTQAKTEIIGLNAQLEILVIEYEKLKEKNK